jgi:DNA-binding NarL/FixJ family response regulator
MTGTVLIVDDHATFRRFLRRLLESAGFRVVGEASGAAAGLAATRALDPDAVVLDVMLPDGSGLEVARALAATRARSRVVLVSSRTAADLGAALAETPAAGFIAKADLTAEALGEVLAR